LDSKNIKVNYGAFPSLIKSKLYPYFGLIEGKDPNILHLQYKRVNNYSKFSNIEGFITTHRSQPHEELVQSLMNAFLISSEEAEKEIAAWKAVHSEDAKAAFYKMRFGGYGESEYTNIKIRLNSPVQMKFLVNGAPNMETVHEIESLISKMIIMSTNSKSKKAASQEQLYETQLAQVQRPIVSPDSRDETHNDIHSSQDGFVDDNMEDYEYDDGMEDFFDEDLAALEKEFAETVVESNPVEENKTINRQPSSDSIQTDSKNADNIDNSENAEGESPSTQKLNMKGYLLSKLKEADPNLFVYKVPADKKKKDYATICGKSVMRQPVVVSDKELERIQTEFPDAISGSVATGSTAEHQKKNRYICPKIWCPKSRVALSFEDFVKKYKRKCPYKDTKEEPIFFSSKQYFGEGDAGLKRDRYPGFLDIHTHPDQYCLPCCFKLAAKQGNKNKDRQDKCVSKFNMNEDVETSAVKTPEKEDIEDVHLDKYILGEHTSPLDNHRFGLLPKAVVDFLGQEHLQGTHETGSGPMKATTQGLFRKGISHTTHSFLDAVASVLDNKNVSSGGDIIRLLLEHLDIMTYVSLENGRIMKMFVDATKQPFQKDAFAAFYTWFKKQTKYVTMMNLQSLLRGMDDIAQTMKQTKQSDFDFTQVPQYQSILREFIIYQSYQKFLLFLKNDAVTKEHIVMFDAVTSKLQHVLNINRYTFVVIEYIYESQKLYVHCPLNHAKEIDHNYPYIFLLKRNAYYEPIYYVKNNEGRGVDITPLLYFKTIAAPIQKLITYVVNNCDRKDISFLRTLKEHLTAKGYRVKYIVLDYGYKTCGVIVDKNLFIPLPSRIDMYFEPGVRYIYISEVPRFICTHKIEEVKKIFDIVRQFTGSPFYTVQSVVQNKNRTVGIVLKGNDGADGLPVFVPLDVTTQERTMRMTFMNGLYILIGYQTDDERAQHVQRIQRGWNAVAHIAEKLRGIMQDNDQLRNEVLFLIDKENPLPLTYKKTKMQSLLQPHLNKAGLEERDMYLLLSYMKDQHKYDVYNLRSRRFSSTDNELFYDHYDIISGKLTEAVEYAKNPHLALMSFAGNKEEVDVTMNDQPIDTFQDVFGSIDDRYDVPVVWRKLMPGYKVVKRPAEYTQTWVFDIMKRVARDLRYMSALTDELYLTVRQNEVIQAFKKDTIQSVLDNPWLAAWLKKKHLDDGALDDILDGMKDIHYYPSVFDVNIMARLAHVNVVLIGRVTRANPDGFEVLYHGSQYFIILQFAYDRTLVIDRFHLIVNVRDKKVLFRQEDMPTAFLDKIAEKLVLPMKS
jgi:hypothetical protein